MAKNSRALAHIRQLCGLGVSSHAAMPAVIKALHELVDSAHNLFLWTDAHGKPIDRYCEVYFPAVAQAATLDLPGKTDLAKIAVHGEQAGNLRRRTKNFFDTAFYSEVYRPMRARQSLDAVVRVAGRPVGLIVLHRDSDTAFSEAEQRSLESILPYLRTLWAQQNTQPIDVFMQTDGADRGVAVINSAGRVLHLSPSAQQMLRMCGLSPGSEAGAAPDALPTKLRVLCDQIGQPIAPQTDRQVSLSVNNAWGRFVFRAFELAGPSVPDEGLVGLSMERQEPLPLAIVRGFAQSPLSPKQRDIALMLALGRTAAQVSEQLRISATTYRDHVEKIYEKLGVNQRADLIRQLTQTPAV
jgi:DNA-binding CsgD family transcriptional regulator